MLYVRFPLSLRNVEDLLHERGVGVSHEKVWFWWSYQKQRLPVGGRKALCRLLLVSTVFLPALYYQSDTFRMLAINLILLLIISNFLPFEQI